MPYDQRQAVSALATFQEVSGLRDYPWEIASGVGEGTIRRFKNGKARSLTWETYEKLADGASSLLNRKVEARELLGDYPNTWPVFEAVLTGDEVVRLPSEGMYRVPAPPDHVSGGVIEVRGRSLLPEFRQGDLLFHANLQPDIDALVGDVVLAQTTNGRRHIRILHSTPNPGHYTLSSINPAYPPLEDVQVMSAAEILWVKHRPRWAAFQKENTPLRFVSG